MPLPVFTDTNGKRQVAAQSELAALDEMHFLLLCRDSGNGFGADGATSNYRKVEVADRRLDPTPIYTRTNLEHSGTQSTLGESLKISETITTTIEFTSCQWQYSGRTIWSTAAHAVLDRYAWRHHRRGLFRMPIAA